MSKKIDITDIDQLSEDPVYVLVAGGFAVGKTYIVEKYVTRFPIMDIDETMAKLGFVNYTSQEFGQAMAVITEQVLEMTGRGESLVAMGSASRLDFAINRLHAAKLKGYTTVLLYIDAPLEQASEQNKARIAAGGRGLKNKEYKIRSSNQGAAKTVASLRDTDLVDYFVHYDNRRIM